MNVNKPTRGSDADSRIGKDVSYIKRMVRKVMGWWRYASVGVWSDTRQSMGVNLLKTVNLSVRSFFEWGSAVSVMCNDIPYPFGSCSCLGVAFCDRAWFRFPVFDAGPTV